MGLLLHAPGQMQEDSIFYAFMLNSVGMVRGLLRL